MDAKGLALAFCLTVCLLCHTSSGGNSSQSNKWQTLLVALQRNPALVQQLRSNPALIRSLKAELLKKQQQQQQQQQQQRSSRWSSSRQKHREQQQQLQQQQQDQCSALRVQNARLRQMISAVLEGKDLPPSSSSLPSDLTSKRRTDFLTEALNHGHHFQSSGGGGRGLGRPQRELNKAQLLLNRVAQENKEPRVSLERVLVTPSATWSTLVDSSTFVTTVTESLTTELPIILRGSKVITTIIEPTVLTGREMNIKVPGSAMNVVVTVNS